MFGQPPVRKCPSAALCSPCALPATPVVRWVTSTCPTGRGCPAKAAGRFLPTTPPVSRAQSLFLRGTRVLKECCMRWHCPTGRPLARPRRVYQPTDPAMKNREEPAKACAPLSPMVHSCPRGRNRGTNKGEYRGRALWGRSCGTLSPRGQAGHRCWHRDF